MADVIQRFIAFLEANINDWESAAEFCEKHVELVQNMGDPEARSGIQEAEKYRARILEHRKLIEQLKKEL